MFKKQKRRYKCLKLFYSVENRIIEQKKVLDFFYNILKRLNEDFSNNFDGGIELNYGQKKWVNSKKYLSNPLNKLNFTDEITFFCFNQLNDGYLIIESSSSKGCHEISLQFGIELDLVSDKSLVRLFLKSCPISFQYGYILNLTEDYDFITERKKRKGLFKGGFEVTKEDIYWQKNIKKTNSGYIKKLYRFNILNNSHLSNKSFIEMNKKGVGDFTKYDENITFWRLDEKEYEIGATIISNSGLVLI